MLIAQPIHWRTLARLLVVSGFLVAAPLAVHSAIEAANGWPEVKVIDMHTHVFNARDLPLTGVLNAFGAPRAVAAVVAEIILVSMPDDEGAPKLEVSIDKVENPTIAELADSQRSILLDYLGRQREEALRAAAAYLKVKADVAILAETIARIGFPADDHLAGPVLIQKLTKAAELGEALKGYVRFIGIMIREHGEIVATLKASYPQSDLFVHHMMDMAAAYDDRPAVPFTDQVRAMQKLDAAFPGKLLHFTAFDPFHRGTALRRVQDAIKSFGAVGMKIYPPSGYRAAENSAYKFPPKPGWTDIWARQRWNSRYDGWMGNDLDNTLQGAFEWAAKNSIPLFTHCSPKGFEAAKDYGLMGDPFFWASALARDKNAGLRLCFGHSGGEAYWFSDPAKDSNQKGKPPGDPWQFGNQVVELCLTYPNVYCEVGYLDGIQDQKKAAVLVQRLKTIVNQRSKDGSWCFGDKIMYGTDWHMIYKEPNYKEYLKAWDEVIKKVDGGKWRQSLFAGNAKKFLRLEDLAKDPRFTTDQQKAWMALSTAIK